MTKPEDFEFYTEYWEEMQIFCVDLRARCDEDDRDECIWDDLESMMPPGFDRLDECSYEFYMKEAEAIKILKKKGFIYKEKASK